MITSNTVVQSHLFVAEMSTSKDAIKTSWNGVAMSTTAAHEINTPAQAKSAFSKLQMVA